MEFDERARAKTLIFELSRALSRAKRDDDVLKAFLAAFPDLARTHLDALGGNRGAAAATLSTAWAAGGNALSEYALGDRSRVLLGIQVAGRIAANKPSKGRG